MSMIVHYFPHTNTAMVIKNEGNSDTEFLDLSNMSYVKAKALADIFDAEFEGHSAVLSFEGEEVVFDDGEEYNE